MFPQNVGFVWKSTYRCSLPEAEAQLQKKKNKNKKTPTRNIINKILIKTGQIWKIYLIALF